MPSIYFKKQALGQWRRDDGESRILVNEERMEREVAKLLKDGWKEVRHGVTFTRMIELVKEGG